MRDHHLETTVSVRPVRRWIRPALSVVAVASLVAACGSSGSGKTAGSPSQSNTSSVSQTNTITVAAPVDIDSFDPQAGPNGTDYQYLYPLYDTLVTLNPANLSPMPGLAQSWKYTDPTTLQLQLRPGVTFQDGTPFNAAAVVFNLNRYKQLGVFTDLQSVTSATAVGDSEVQITLSKPDSSLVTALGDRAGMMVSPTAVQQYGKNFGEHPVGTGPYQFVSWTPGSGATYRKYPDYYGGGVAARPNQLVYKIIANPSTAANALVSGQVNYAYDLNVSDISRLKSTPGIVVDPAPTNYFYMLYLNLAQAPLNNTDVRQALNYAINRKALVQIAQRGLGEIATTPLPKASSDYVPGPAGPYTYNPTKAKQLLASSGQKNLTISMVTYASPIETQIAQALSSELSQVGVKLATTTEDLTTGVNDYFVNKKFNAASLAWSGRPASLSTYTTLFGAPSYQNPGNVALPGMEASLAQLSAAETPGQKKAALGALNQVLNQTAPYVPLFFQVNVVAFRNYIKGNFNDLQGKNYAIRDLQINH